MRYSINTDKTINQLVPHIFGGHKLILYLQAICKPLQDVNDNFCNWAKEKKIESCMTSQVIMLEWYLNRKFSKYFLNQSEKITIANEDNLNGLAIYHENSEETSSYLIYGEGETVPAGTETKPLYHQNERRGYYIVSFLVHSPMINTSLITEEEYKSMLSNIIDKYKICGKTYAITINTK